jgi:hypothetical protein
LDTELLVLKPMTWFVLHPLRILPVAVFTLLPCLPPLRAHYSSSHRRLFLLCAACWGAFMLTEANTSPNSNIRVDLVLTIPASVIALIVWLIVVVPGYRTASSGHAEIYRARQERPIRSAYERSGSTTMKNKLREVGFFRELSYGDQNGESLESAVAKASLENIERIVSYLQSGVAGVVAPRISRDFPSPRHEIIGSLALRTDGEFLWPSDLAHYVEKYRVSLPADFLRHIEMLDWQVPAVDISALTAIVAALAALFALIAAGTETLMAGLALLFGLSAAATTSAAAAQTGLQENQGFFDKSLGWFKSGF